MSAATFIRPDGKEKVTGSGRYTADLDLTGQLHAKLRYADHTHARIVRIDTTKARAHPGVLADLNVSSHKTREFRQTAAALLGLQGPWLWVDQEANRNLELAARNLPGVKVGRARGLNVVDVLGHRTLVLSEAAVTTLAQDLQA